MEHNEKASRNKGLSKKRFEKESLELSAKIKDIEEELVSLFNAFVDSNRSGYIFLPGYYRSVCFYS